MAEGALDLPVSLSKRNRRKDVRGVKRGRYRAA